jgi:hypothetical protein
MRPREHVVQEGQIGQRHGEQGGPLALPGDVVGRSSSKAIESSEYSPSWIIPSARRVGFHRIQSPRFFGIVERALRLGGELLGGRAQLAGEVGRANTPRSSSTSPAFGTGSPAAIVAPFVVPCS